MLEDLFDAAFMALLVVVYAGVHRTYGWRGTLLTLAPTMLMFALSAADFAGWIRLFEPSQMLRAAFWWLGISVAGTAFGVFEAWRERRRQRDSIKTTSSPSAE